MSLYSRLMIAENSTGKACTKIQEVQALFGEDPQAKQDFAEILEKFAGQDKLLNLLECRAVALMANGFDLNKDGVLEPNEREILMKFANPEVTMPTAW